MRYEYKNVFFANNKSQLLHKSAKKFRGYTKFYLHNQSQTFTQFPLSMKITLIRMFHTADPQNYTSIFNQLCPVNVLHPCSMSMWVVDLK